MFSALCELHAALLRVRAGIMYSEKEGDGEAGGFPSVLLLWWNRNPVEPVCE